MTLNSTRLPLSRLSFYTEEEAFPGVRRVAEKLRMDMERVFGRLPDNAESIDAAAPYALIYGTAGHSPVLDRLAAEGHIDLSCLAGKREVFALRFAAAPFPGVKAALVVAGSDKRGTIFGLFHISGQIGVSPLTGWSDVPPAPLQEFFWDKSLDYTSKEPSVRFRGLFINDEWPAFGAWANKRFGGFNAAMYEHVFELILRHKGNFFWPAMWASCLSCDGPGLEAARLADEYGIVMGTSHHEPCIRHGEEYSHLRGPGSPYGDAWNFRTNREGILRFWRDGLRRNKGLENVVTLGMRGERDSAILGREATLADNIGLLRDVIRCQNQLIREELSPKLSETPRCLVMFTEVERFYHGEDGTGGLAGDPCLDGVTLMLCDDNFGNIKSMPRGEMLEHKGGFGLYYHFDFHGGPTSYEWVNSSYLPKMWEQLSMAYDFGVRDIWVVNVGDLALQEYPLSYWFAMAYDMDAYGSAAPGNSGDFTCLWLREQFGDAFSEGDYEILKRLLDTYTLLNHNRKPEVMHAGVYHPVHWGEAEEVLSQTRWILDMAGLMRAKCPESLQTAFFELIYFPAAASANLQRMQVLAGRNALYAARNRVDANDLAEEVAACVRLDRELTEELHSIGGGRFYGFGLSEHIGFTHWLEEGNRYPLMTQIEPANKPRIIVSHAYGSEYTEGGSWTGKTLVFKDFLRPDRDRLSFDIACGSRMAVPYEILCGCPWLSLSSLSGCVVKCDRIQVKLDRTQLAGRDSAEIQVRAENALVRIRIEADNTEPEKHAAMCFHMHDGYICMEAEHYAAKQGDFLCLSPYGRTKSAMVALPLGTDFSGREDKPWLSYRFVPEKAGRYVLSLYLSPSNPLFFDASIELLLSVNGGEESLENTTGKRFRAHDFSCKPWVEGVTDNIRIYRRTVELKEGENSLRLGFLSPGLALERLLLVPEDAPIPASYLGPPESYYTR